MKTSNAEILPLGFQLDEYTVEQVLGRGGFGITYRARDNRLGRLVAIKEFFPATFARRDSDGYSVISTQHRFDHDEDLYGWGLERFLAEAKILAQIKHSHVVHLNRYFPAHGTAYLVMDYEAGESLDVVLKESLTLSEKDICGLLADLLPALTAVHGQGLYHRDIKPANLYVRQRDGGVMLIDFGAARAALSTASQGVTTLVSKGYSPPEQYTSEGDSLGPWTDIYALGAVLYQCVVGQPPPESTARLLNDDKVAQQLNASAAKYSAPLLTAIQRCLELQPQARYASVADLQLALAQPMAHQLQGESFHPAAALDYSQTTTAALHGASLPPSSHRVSRATESTALLPPPASPASLRRPSTLHRRQRYHRSQTRWAWLGLCGAIVSLGGWFYWEAPRRADTGLASATIAPVTAEASATAEDSAVALSANTQAAATQSMAVSPFPPAATTAVAIPPLPPTSSQPPATANVEQTFERLQQTLKEAPHDHRARHELYLLIEQSFRRIDMALQQGDHSQAAAELQRLLDQRLLDHRPVLKSVILRGIANLRRAASVSLSNSTTLEADHTRKNLLRWQQAMAEPYAPPPRGAAPPR